MRNNPWQTADNILPERSNVYWVIVYAFFLGMGILIGYWIWG